MKYKKIILPNGLRIITVPLKNAPTTTVLVMVETGSNYETKEQNGLSHFLEHMCFKGTKKYPTPLDISLEFDRIGAENNAFTSNELTGYYAKASTKHWRKLMNIVGEMYINPTLPQDELEKERGVVLQEISMYFDMPQRIVQNVFGELLYGDTAQGRLVLGPAENIKRLKREDFLNYRNKQYVPEKTMIVVAGNVSEREILYEANKIFGEMKRGKAFVQSKVQINQKTPAIKIFEKDTDQTHLILGFHGYPAKHKNSIVAAVLSGVLSAGMSSRLFKRLRDEMGACYYVKSSHDAYSTYGNFSIATGINKDRLNEVVKVLLGEYKNLKEVLVSEEELNKVKEFMISHLYMSLETSEAVSIEYACAEVVNKVKTPMELEKEIKKVTAKQIQNVAQELFTNSKLNLAIVGKGLNKNSLQKILKL